MPQYKILVGKWTSILICWNKLRLRQTVTEFCSFKFCTFCIFMHYTSRPSKPFFCTNFKLHQFRKNTSIHPATTSACKAISICGNILTFYSLCLYCFSQMDGTGKNEISECGEGKHRFHKLNTIKARWR